ncbi:uncharacterized protein FSUBG_6105 [Fusarium subglutinans]|uniref:Uncharacterized protein n=1 Tax=Gibberella subglutinans TaxID=42677 RepID=A0A8H5V0Y2_GIBSU|nr:uncharacterized protein FSUBG_6105 [Fusarium subglutinans]KAF5606496.1 hypothetical protein FSUBG_6105 [Fusarium subglutinans]
MAWATAEENTFLRARQLRRFYAKHISSEGPLKYADKITPTDMDLATILAPDYKLKYCAEGEEEYPEQWELKPKSLSFILNNFRPKAKEIKTAMDEVVDAFIAGESTTIPPIFPGGYGDRHQVHSSQVVTKGLQRALAEVRKEKNAAEKKAKLYLARAEKAEAELQELREELEEEGDEDNEAEEDEEDKKDDEDRKRKRRKID